jgi:2-dehydro-3-deoxygalactonokinase
MSGAILIDWGTSNARAYLLDPDGSVVDRRRAPLGIRAVPPGGFPAALEGLLGPWMRGNATWQTILMCGMVGSRQGWVEVPYRPCPARLEDLATALCPVPALPGAWIVPGVRRSDGDTRHDVMRGEEVQLFGAVADEPDRDGVLCFPGTHSKWVLYQDRSLADFATAMTGEVFQTLRQNSLLGVLMRNGTADAELAGTALVAFRRGLDRSGEAGGLLHHLFGVRAEGLFASIPEGDLPAYLSGILIGHEIRSMAGLFNCAGPIRLVAENPLAGHYAAAFERLGLAYQSGDAEEATLRGLTRILETRLARAALPS